MDTFLFLSLFLFLVIVVVVVMVEVVVKEDAAKIGVLFLYVSSLRKHAYSNTLKILPSKNGKFSDKNSDIFHNSAQNIDCGYPLEPPCRGGSNEYPQSMFLSRNNKNNVYPCKPQFYYIKVGFKGVKIIWVCLRDVLIFRNNFLLNIWFYRNILR